MQGGTACYYPSLPHC